MRIIVRAIPRAGARRSHLRLHSWFSNVNFRPSNRLSEPMGSISIALKGREQGILCLPCAMSAEYFLRPVTVHSITSPSQKQRTHSWYLSRQVSNDSSFVFHSHSVSIGSVFGVSFAHQRLSNHRLHTSLYTCSFGNVFNSSYFLCSFFPPALACLSLHARAAWKPITILQMLCCKIFVLKYFRRTPTLRKFFNTKIFPKKISCISWFTVLCKCWVPLTQEYPSLISISWVTSLHYPFCIDARPYNWLPCTWNF